MSIQSISNHSYIDYTPLWNDSENSLPSKVVQAVGALLVNLGKILANATLYCLYSLQDVGISYPLLDSLQEFLLPPPAYSDLEGEENVPPLPDYMLQPPPPYADAEKTDRSWTGNQ